MNSPHADRREKRREPLYLSRRRYPRVFLDADWFVESQGCSTLGRGLEISPRGALLPVERTGGFADEVTLYVSLPSRPKMFRAKGQVTPGPGARGWVIRFTDVTVEDLNLLGRALIDEVGLTAFPNLDRKFARFTGLHRSYLKSVT